MNEPRRLIESGGVSQRLLDSASIDKPSAAARRRAVMLAATAGAFSRTAAGSAGAAKPKASFAKTLATWVLVGAAASGTLALLGAKLLDVMGDGGSHSAAAPVMAELPAAPSAAPARSPDISAEPSFGVKTPSIAAAPPAPAASSASADEVREIGAARAALARGDDAAAVASLDAYDKAYPNGALRSESMALRTLALKHRGPSPR